MGEDEEEEVLILVLALTLKKLGVFVEVLEGCGWFLWEVLGSCGKVFLGILGGFWREQHIKKT